ncbi:hypothetical protein DFH09DRAFT_1125055 [Mycena vulgaris]|nr:hypothetical protein DFH09DRAFT_1125055 [Mycena vulgaris]
MAKTGRELFGLKQPRREAGLQTLPENFDLRQLPLPGPLPETYTEVQFAATVVHGRSIHRPFRHPQTHNLPAASIQFRSHEILPMHLFVHFATHAAYSLGIPCTRMYSLPTTRQLWTENFERKVHRRGIKAYDADPGVVDLWFRYLQRHAMGGVGMRCVKWERMPMGVGQKAQSEQWTTTKSKIKDLGVKIVQREMGVPTPRPDNIKTVVQK